jgi:hypothetical protein
LGPIHDYTTRASAIDLECDKEGPFCDTAIHDTFAIKGDKDRADATGDEESRQGGTALGSLPSVREPREAA